MQSDLNQNNRLDKMGITVATVCAIHCVFLPLLIPVLPLIGLSFIGEHVFEDIVLAISMVAGFIALYTGYQRYHKRLYPLYCLALGGFIYSFKDSFGEGLHPYLIGVGAGLIVFAHIMNVKLCRSCKSC
ncbi:MerC domain-containing protein [Catenovulum adriaticum]|uniref:MerC domain-containing protein n=1 Tax=Catenovulum adriaticum TaxID=2984846 RepID=A0ABY7AK32_9ALTE|nr:MerC domain-containing protein [Catenovulum sp. TS8]WAJ69907.1 MerC domain-containing protein [Catenovulum sp. TS8]